MNPIVYCLAGALILLLAKSPIIPIYKFENDSTNHIDFQSDCTHQTTKAIDKNSLDLYSNFHSDQKKQAPPHLLLKVPT